MIRSQSDLRPGMQNIGIALFVLVFIFFGARERNRVGQVPLDADDVAGLVVNQAFIPKIPYVKRLYSEDNVEIIHALPPGNTNAKPKGIALLFHGCTRKGEDWFTLPEESIIVRKLLRGGIAVAAVTSYNRISGCWDKVDLERLPGAFSIFLSYNKWATNISVFAIGASSGAAFASSIPTVIPLKGIYMQIGRPILDMVEDWKVPHPQALHFLYMKRDVGLKLAFEFFLKSLHNTPTIQDIFMANPCAITEDRLVKRIHDMTVPLAADLVAELKKRLLIDENGFPQERTVYTLTTELPEREMFFAVQEEIKVCFAHHELTSEHFDIVLKAWLSLLS